MYICVANFYKMTSQYKLHLKVSGLLLVAPNTSTLDSRRNEFLRSMKDVC